LCILRLMYQRRKAWHNPESPYKSAPPQNTPHNPPYIHTFPENTLSYIRYPPNIHCYCIASHKNQYVPDDPPPLHSSTPAYPDHCRIDQSLLLLLLLRCHHRPLREVSAREYRPEDPLHRISPELRGKTGTALRQDRVARIARSAEWFPRNLRRFALE